MAWHENLPNLRLFCTALFISLSGGSFHLGYQMWITNPAKEVFINFVNSSMHSNDADSTFVENIWGTIVSLFNFGAIIGSILIKFVGDKLDGKKGFLFSHLVIAIGLGLTIVSKMINSFILFSFMRFLMGVATSLSLGFAVVFITECSPKSCCATVNMITGIVSQIGCVAGIVVSMRQTFGTQELWWLMYMFGLICTMPLIIWWPFMQESPTYFARRNDFERAQKSIGFYYGGITTNVEDVLNDLKESINKNEKQLGLFEVFKEKSTFIGCIAGLLAGCSVAFNGIAVLSTYSVDILINNGLTHFQASITELLIMSMTVVIMIFSTLFIEKYGKRKVLLYSNGGVLLSNAFIVLFLVLYGTYQITFAGWLMVITMLILRLVNTAGVLPLSFFIATALVKPEARMAAQSWATFGQMLSRTIAVAIYLPIRNTIGEPLAYLILFVVTTAFIQIYFYRMLPNDKVCDVSKPQNNDPVFHGVKYFKNEETSNEINK